MSDSDNEAPEAVSFSASKSSAVKQLKDQSKSSNATKQKMKDLRKAREELYKTQKQKKLERLASLLPTEDELRQLPVVLEDKDPTLVGFDKSTPQSHLQASRTIFNDDEEGEIDMPCEEEISTPHSTKFKVVHVRKDINLNLQSRVPAALLNYRETMLYGMGSKAKRESSEVVLHRTLKMKQIHQG